MKLNIRQTEAKRWDDALQEANSEYTNRMHTLCWDNCHCHVAMALNNFGYRGSTSHNMITVWFYTIALSRYVRYAALIQAGVMC